MYLYVFICIIQQADDQNNLWIVSEAKAHCKEIFVLGTWHFPTEIWIRFKQTFQIRQKLMQCATYAINKSVSMAFLATPPYRKVHLKTIQSHALNKGKQNMQNLTGFSHQLLATGTCACSPQKLKFLCSTNQNIFTSNGSFKTIMNKIPTQSLAFLTFPFTFWINHFIPEQPTEVNNSRTERFIVYLQYMNWANGYSECHQTEKLKEVDGSSPLFHHILIHNFPIHLLMLILAVSVAVCTAISNSQAPRAGLVTTLPVPDSAGSSEAAAAHQGQQ